MGGGGSGGSGGLLVKVPSHASDILIQIKKERKIKDQNYSGTMIICLINCPKLMHLYSYVFLFIWISKKALIINFFSSRTD